MLALGQQAALQCGDADPSPLSSKQHTGSRGRLQQRRPPARPQRLARRAAAAASSGSAAPPRRVVVTGQGVVSSLGHEPAEFYSNLLEGKSGIGPITNFDAGEGWGRASGLSLLSRQRNKEQTEYAVRFAGEVAPLDCDGWLARKWEKRVDPVMRYIHVAGKKALGDAGLPWDGPEIADLDRERAGIIVGTALGGMMTFATAVELQNTISFRRMNPFCIPFAIQARARACARAEMNMGGAMLAMDIGFMGPNYPIATACATGNYCIMAAADHIRRGDADLMLAGGAEACVIPSAVGGFIACRALSQRNDAPREASRPWDKSRDGFVMGEGAAGVLVLEELEHAKARGATILAEFLGGAATCDAHDMTNPEPNGRGVILCIERALANAGVAPEEIDYVNAHATSTPAGDMAEYRAITAALPHKGLKINSSKSMIGHLLGAAGAVEAVACVQALQTGWLHPNLNLQDPEDEVDLSILVGATKEKADPEVALSNSFGFGGHNSAIIFRKFRE
eukprot:scaffold12.g7954.t1